ncbi:MerR family transcriptional regulator [Streptomyces sp. RO-S4]|nr:MerR family transcriptional regulator [Streptomyces sp. RO-S4]
MEVGNPSPWRTVPTVVRGKVRMPSESQPYVDGRQPDQDRPPVADRLDDDHFPAYTMGRAAELVGATPAFLRALGDARLITPMRSDGGHRRYSRHQLRLAARARELVDQGTPVDAACRIVSLEEQLERAEQMNEDLRRQGADPVHGHR